MHHHSDRKPGTHRGWLHLGLPENPWCWLRGHTPRAVVTRYRFNIAPSLWTDCRVCGRRYQGAEDVTASYLRDVAERDPSLTPRQHAEALTARRLENLERYGEKQFLSDVDRRSGWSARQAVLHHELHWRTPGNPARGFRSWGAQLHLGNEHSETPIDAHVQLGGLAALYMTIGGIGGRFAQLVGRGHKRDLALHYDPSDRGLPWEGRLRWKIWHNDDGGNDDTAHRCNKHRRPTVWPWSAGRQKYRSWLCLRDGHIDLNPVDVWWGSRYFAYEDLGPVRSAFVDVGAFDGDVYVVDFQLQRQSLARRHGPAWARRAEVRLTADWSCSGGGIPVRNSWKGDGIRGGGVSLDGWGDAELRPEDDWLPLAVQQLRAKALRDRERYGYVPPSGVSA